MTAQEKALQLYNDAYERWATELSHDNNKLIAKSIAKYVCDEMINEYIQNCTFTYLEWIDYRISFLEEVKIELEKL